MKRFWLGLGILLLFLALGIGTTVGMARICHPLAEMLEQAADRVQDGQWSQAQALARDARDRWERYREVTASVTNHEPMEEADALFDALDIYLQQKDVIRFADCCVRLAALADAIGEAQAIYWWNVL